MYPTSNVLPRDSINLNAAYLATINTTTVLFYRGLFSQLLVLRGHAICCGARVWRGCRGILRSDVRVGWPITARLSWATISGAVCDRYRRVLIDCVLGARVANPNGGIGPTRSSHHLLVQVHLMSAQQNRQHSGLILGLRPTNERRRLKVTPSLIGWAQT